MKLWVLGVGMGPQHITAEVAEALRGVDYVIAARKGDDDALLAAREAIAAAYDLPVVTIADPRRERDPAQVARSEDYARAVTDWHAARVDAYERELRERGGNAAFLVWGDPSLYDSTIRIAEALSERLPMAYAVLPGVSAPQLLAARHRIVLHPIGSSVHLTTARRLRGDIAAGQTNLVVMLGRSLDAVGIEDWSIWWGANLGAESERLIAGRVGEVLPQIDAARETARAAAGWVMDISLLRAP